MKKTDNYPLISIEYPTVTASIFLIVVFGLPVLLSGVIILLFSLRTGQLVSIVRLVGGIFILTGGFIIHHAIEMVQRSDRLIIDFQNRVVTRSFGLGGIYIQFSEKTFEFSIDTIDELFIDREIYTSDEGRFYLLKCGFNDLEGNNVVLHIGTLNPVKNTIKLLAKVLEKDIWDLTTIEERKIPYDKTELLEEIRFPTHKYLKAILLRVSLIIFPFPVSQFLLILIFNMFVGLDELRLQISTLCGY